VHNNIARPDTETNFLSNCNIKCLWREAISEEDETLLCLQAQLSSDEESQFNEVMSLAVRSPLEVLEHQLEPHLHGSLNNPSNDMLVRSQAAPVHKMLSERTPVSFLSLITWRNLIFNLFETFKRTSKA
jgi:hypothetical protein